jgi:hypothetical protein
VAAQRVERGADGLDEARRRSGADDEVGDDLGVGLRGEHRARRRQLVLELHVVLDDPVDDDVDAVAGVVVRVGVLLRDARRASPSACGRCPVVAGALATATGAAAPPRRGDRHSARFARLPTARTASRRPVGCSEIPAES